MTGFVTYLNGGAISWKMSRFSASDPVAYCIQQYACCTVSVLQNRIYICSMFGLRKEPKE